MFKADAMTIPTLRGPGELLATLPLILGFTPVESIVVVGIGAGGEIGPVMRVDRKDCLTPQVCSSITRALVAHLSRQGANAAILVSYTAADVRVSCEAAVALRDGLARLVSRIDMWAVTEGHYFAPGCADIACCPVGGTEIPAPDQGAVFSSEEATWLAGKVRVAPRKLWGTADALERRRCASAAVRWKSKRDGDGNDWRRRSMGIIQRCLSEDESSGTPMPEADIGKMLSGLADVRVRDAVIVWLVAGSAKAIDDVLAGHPTPEVANALDAMLDPSSSCTPSEIQIQAVRSVLLRGVALARRKDAAPLLAVLALVEWWSGSSMSALSMCEAAEECVPGYRLADLIRATILAGVMPGWLE
jgi:hypothetical protein